MRFLNAERNKRDTGLSNGARLGLIAINGANDVLCAVLKTLAQQKRHRPPPDKISGTSSETALCPHEIKILTREFQVSN
jgi:hypothetical protein